VWKEATVSAGVADSAAVCDVDGATSPGRAKTSALGRKTVQGLFRGGGAIEGVEAKGSANDTRLAAAEPPEHSAAAEPPGRLPGGQPRRLGLPGVASAVVQAFRRLTATTSSLDPCCVKERPPQRMTV
jgi:hypothetical protein